MNKLVFCKSWSFKNFLRTKNKVIHWVPFKTAECRHLYFLIVPENKTNRIEEANSAFHGAYIITVNHGARARAPHAEKTTWGPERPWEAGPLSRSQTASRPPSSLTWCCSLMAERTVPAQKNGLWCERAAEIPLGPQRSRGAAQRQDVITALFGDATVCQALCEVLWVGL